MMKKRNNQRKHSLYELFRIMTKMLSRDGPFELNLKDVVDYCRTVENENHETFTSIIDSEGAVDLTNFLDTYSNTFSCPIIYYKRKRCDNDTVDIIHKLRKFLQANGLNKKHLIAFNFPADGSELLKCKAAGFSPNSVIEIIPNVSHIPAKESQNLSTNKLDEVCSYFEKNTTRFTLTDNVNENCYRLKNAISQYAHTSNRSLDTGFHLQRIVFLGQIGSGCKTQARLLAKQWHLVFLDFRVLLLQYAKLNTSFHDLLMKVRNVRQLNRKLLASILFDRITKRDCLDNGWILVGYVSSAADLEIMEKQFYITPNKIVFIHCRHHLCLGRLRARIIKHADTSKQVYTDEDIKYAKLGFIDLYSPCCAINYVVTEMDHFCRNRREIVKYCQDRAKYIAHIDGEHSVSTVTTLVSVHIEKYNF